MGTTSRQIVSVIMHEGQTNATVCVTYCVNTLVSKVRSTMDFLCTFHGFLWGISSRSQPTNDVKSGTSNPWLQMTRTRYIQVNCKGSQRKVDLQLARCPHQNNWFQEDRTPVDDCVDDNDTLLAMRGPKYFGGRTIGTQSQVGHFLTSL